MLFTLALPGCGGAGGESTGSSRTSALTAATLTPSLGAAARQLESRSGSTLRRSLERSLGPSPTLKIDAGSTECRKGSATPSVTNPRRIPYACIVTGTATPPDRATAFTLGFVVFHVNGLCWRASNERIAAAGSGPIVLSRREALEPANVIAGCAGG